MFRKIKGYFAGEETLEEAIKASLEIDKTGKVTSHDLHVASAVLLVQVASSDDQIAAEEAQVVCSMIEKNFGLSQEQIPNLIETAVAARRQRGKIDDFIEVLNVKFDQAQRKLLLAMIWKVVLADSRVEKLEERMVIQLRNRLRLTLEDGEEARKMAEAGQV